MFIGHFGLAFASKRVAPRVSVGTTIFAAMFLDAVWPVLVISGVERVEISPGITRVTPLDFVHYPWSHSLVMAIAWGMAFAVWNNVPATMAVEFGLFALGIYLYVSCTRARDRTGTMAFWAVAWSGLIGYLFVAWGWWIDRHREVAGKTA